MKRKISALALLTVVVALAANMASAHECTNPNDPNDCHETPVMPNWRDGNYVPLFDLEDREDPNQREDAQRWREECQGYDEDGRYRSNQQCAWLYGGTSFFPDDNGNRSPNELHAGIAASHCFLFEVAHQCQNHNDGEGTHDAHGGAIYADICLTENPESKYCDEGMKDTQAGVTIMDHNSCGTVVPIVACTDEYHVIRPFDQAYTEKQMNDSLAYIERIINDPYLYLCGYEEYQGDEGCIVPRF